ncbi:flagellar biosynthetic protein FliQ [Alkalilimnicola ehrlichii]|uniref:Flagellar biosynthetic protein FliQ n=1 Tax=Alkalilimnicola ehrlichii TaxID=351052 RepID=A0A3E0WUM9_9GAMM|nr:flagellar biosynthesis protein FliQ [Alkalilimnicola ehrlichii]RFA28534.1 flagellar biosynthetic protein FliQ [Alkalilimnicola ehrlichii]RFA35696.1 flagellar biosynthetic protein FliQ [Alkalilimnicola ehrlichii]
MSPDVAIELGMQALTVVVLLAAPILLSALAAGLLIGMFQAATQINEQTLSFVPKLGVLAVVLFIASPWMLNVILDFTHTLYARVPDLVNYGL